MRAALRTALGIHLRAPLFSCKGLVLRAALLGLCFGICEVAGLQEHTTFLSGTAASVGGGWNASATWGMIYIAAYLGFVLAAPILLLAAALLAGWERWLKPGRSRAELAEGTPPSNPVHFQHRSEK